MASTRENPDGNLVANEAVTPDPVSLGFTDFPDAPSETSPGEPTTTEASRVYPFDQAFQRKVIRLAITGEFLQQAPDCFQSRFFGPRDGNRQLKTPHQHLAEVVERFIKDHPAEHPDLATMDELVKVLASRFKPAQRQQVEDEWQAIRNLEIPDPSHTINRAKQWAQDTTMEMAVEQSAVLIGRSHDTGRPIDRPKILRLVEEAMKVGDAQQLAEPGQLQIPPFPQEAYVGLAGEIALTLAQYVPYPPQFMFMDYLTILGAAVSPRVSMIGSDMAEHPRLFVVKIGPVGSGKSRSQRLIADRLFKPILKRKKVEVWTDEKTGKEEKTEIDVPRLLVIKGVGSAEGVATKMERDALPGTGCLLLYDELQPFVDKSSIQGAVLLPMVNSLFHETFYENVTKQKPIKVENAHLSLLGACTPDTYQKMFSGRYHDIGWFSRLFLVYGEIPTTELAEEIPPEVLRPFQEKTRALLERIEQKKIHEVRLGADARVFGWDPWLKKLPRDPIATRLDVYGYRLLTLFALTTGASRITPELVKKVLPLLEYQWALRKELEPEHAEGVVAQREDRIRRPLVKVYPAGLAERDLKKNVNVRRHGQWCYDRALDNLKRASVVEVEPAPSRKGRFVRLTETGKREME